MNNQKFDYYEIIIIVNSNEKNKIDIINLSSFHIQQTVFKKFFYIILSKKKNRNLLLNFNYCLLI